MIDRKTAKEEGFVFEDYHFRVSSDDMFVVLETPLLTRAQKKEFIKIYSKIKEFLKEQGITLILEEPEPLDDKFIVAKGIPPKEGKPETLEFLPKFEKLIKSPEVHLPSDISQDEEKMADLRESVQKIICSRENEAIARWVPSIPPTPGVNVWGDQIPPPPLKEERTFELSENLYLDEQEKLIKAKLSGVLNFDGQKLEIYPEYTLKGDVDFSVGNIYFYGKKLTINGDIKYGFKVICEGDLELIGCTENNVYLEVKGNFICNGVIRGENTVLKIWGDAKIQGGEFCKIFIYGNLNVKDYLVFSYTYVEGNIIVEEGKGWIYGGEVTATGNITLKIAGHSAQTKTILKAGYKPEIIEGYLHLLEKIEILKDNIEKIDQGLKIAYKLKNEGRLDEKKLKLVEKLIEERKKIEQKFTDTKEKIKELSEKLLTYRNKTVIVKQKIFPNVIVEIAEYTFTTDQEITGQIIFYVDVEGIKIKEGS